MHVVDRRDGLDRPSGPLAQEVQHILEEAESDDPVKIVVDKEKAETSPSKKPRFRSDLRTIRESPESVFIVSYIDMEDAVEEGRFQVPQPQPAVLGVTILELDDLEKVEEEATSLTAPTEEETSSTEKEEEEKEEGSCVAPSAAGDATEDLRRLNERADRLCQELKQLNIESASSSVSEAALADINVEPDEVIDDNADFKEIMRQYSDFIIILRSEEEAGSAEMIAEDVDTIFEPPPTTADLPKDPELGSDNAISIETTANPEAIDDQKEQSGQEETKEEEKPSSMMQGDEVLEPEGHGEEPITKESSSNETPKDDECADENDVSEHKVQQPPSEEEIEAAYEEAMSMIKNFKPKRPKMPTCQFPDLNLEGETAARVKSHGACHYWRMPFRHQLFEENSPESEKIVSWYLRGPPNEDAFRFAPSGDIYSYFQRRPPFPMKFTYPLAHEMKKALGGPARKL